MRQTQPCDFPCLSHEVHVVEPCIIIKEQEPSKTKVQPSRLGLRGGGHDLLAVLVEPDAGRGSAVAATGGGAHTGRLSAFGCSNIPAAGAAERRECVSSTAKALLKRIRLGEVAVVTLPGKTTYRTILPWMAQETQYCSFRYILGTVYSAKTEASEMSPVQLLAGCPSRNQKSRAYE